MEERIYTVYMHTCLKNNKKYIGITMCKPEQRWQNGKAYRTCRLFNSAIKKYGWDNFEHKILFSQLTKKEASDMEISLIKKYQSNNINFGYNLDSGGLGLKTTHKNTTKSYITTFLFLLGSI